MDLQSSLAFGSLVLGGVGFACTILIQQRKAAIDYGRLCQQVDDLKDEGDSYHDLSRQFAAFKGEMTAEMRNQTGKMDRLVNDLVWLRQAALPDRETGRRP